MGDTIVPAFRGGARHETGRISAARCRSASLNALRAGRSARGIAGLGLRQSAAAQPKTNAICRLMETSPLPIEEAAGRSFAGVPFLIKDCAQDYAGLPTTYGSRSMLGVAAPEHAYVVRRYLDAGC